MSGSGAIEPGAAVLATLGVRAVSPLGGRQNQHWLVESRGERLVLRRCQRPIDDVRYEARLLERVAALGWPVATAVAEPVKLDGRVWCLFPFLPGEPPDTADPLAEQRARGRLLAAFHADLTQLGGDGWRRCEAILADPTLDLDFAAHEHERPKDIRALR